MGFAGEPQLMLTAGPGMVPGMVPPGPYGAAGAGPGGMGFGAGAPPPPPPGAGFYGGPAPGMSMGMPPGGQFH